MNTCSACGCAFHECECDGDAPQRSPQRQEQESDAEQRFREFHRDNPEVYQELMQLVRVAVARGRKKIGIKMLWEVVRWNRFLRTTDEKYKLNNNHHSRYARLIMQTEPDLTGIFETRELKS